MGDFRHAAQDVWAGITDRNDAVGGDFPLPIQQIGKRLSCGFVVSNPVNIPRIFLLRKKRMRVNRLQRGASVRNRLENVHLAVLVFSLAVQIKQLLKAKRAGNIGGVHPVMKPVFRFFIPSSIAGLRLNVKSRTHGIAGNFSY